MLLKGFLRRDGVKKKLALVFRFLRTGTVAAGLRHVIAPLVIELGQLIELLLEIVFRRLGVGSLSLFICRFGQLLEDGICLHFLLHEIAQLEKRRLEDEEALLKLRSEDLLQRKILRLKHPRTRHGQRVPTDLPTASKFRAATRR